MNHTHDIREYPTAAIAVQSLLERAASLRASDVHLDPSPRGTNIRLRVDGTMEHMETISPRFHEEMIARLKILSGARTDIHAVPQDGRWRAELSGDAYNMRISFMPTYHGECAVVRLLPARAAADASFARLGFIPDHVRLIDEALKKTHGLILVTGPTGSGKTTTLHACLSLKADEPLSVITLEDPVEYEIPGVRQVHVRHTHGVTFAAGLRAALRQDPDVIMVGEIRDKETAQLAVQAALTGHLVLSTLHTNSAMEAMPRLIDMGVDPYLLASTLALVIAQRLVRNVCRACDAEGCAECRHTGYKGRSVIAEVCGIDRRMQELIARRESAGACFDHARSQGWRTLFDDGMEKAEWGMTSDVEVLRVLHP